MAGNLAKKSGPAGAVDLYTYDKQGRELSHTQQKSDGSQSITTSSRYDPAGNKRFTVDGNNVTTENIYNEINKLTTGKITVTDSNSTPHLHETDFGYDLNGNQTTQTTKLGTTDLGTYTNIYDPLDRLIEKQDPFTKSIEKLAYNHNGVQVSSTDALGKTTTFTYDKNNRLLSTRDPLYNPAVSQYSHAQSQTYDNAGNIKTKTDGRGHAATFNYDAFNRLISVVNAKNETTSYTYDANNNQLTQTDGLNHITTYEYNVINKPVKKIDHGGRSGTYPNYTYVPAKVESYTYDATGNLLSTLDRNGYTTTYTYDVHNRFLSRTSGTLSVIFTYDSNGNQLTMTDSTGATIRTYDELNRTKTKTVPGVSGSFTFLYDITSGVPAGQVGETDTDPKGNATAMCFDQAGRMVSVTAAGNTTTYTYYDNGSKHTVVYPGGGSEEYTYYDDGLLHTLINKKGDQTVIDSYTYSYDGAHNLVSKIDGKGTTTYGYDNLNRLQYVTEPNGKFTEYSYNAAGNRTYDTETLGADFSYTNYYYNEQNRLTGSITKHMNVTTQTMAYTYDNNGSQLTATKTPYINGIPQTPQATACTFDRFNRLATTIMPDGTNITNTYNGENYRTGKQVGSVLTKYLYIQDKVALELDASNNQTARNIQGTSLIARTASSTTLYYMYNGHADVTALINAGGTVQATYYYDAFGNLLEQTGTFNNNITYAGYQYDKETGYYYLNARYYDPVIARFLSEDTVTGDPNDPLSLNLYTYCHNEPLMYTDPSGNVEVYGNETDIAIAERILGDDTGYNYHITTASDHLTSYDLDPGSIIVGGVHARGGVGGEENPSNGVLRLWGADRDATADAIRAYKKSIDRIEEGMTGTAKSTGDIKTLEFLDSSKKKDKEALADYLLIEFIRESVYSGRTLQTQGAGTNTFSIQSANVNSYNFVGVYYLNKSDGAFLQGHAALMLVTSDGKGIIYSFAGDATQTAKAVSGQDIPGKLSKAVDLGGNITTVDVNDFLKYGRVRLENFDGLPSYEDHYDRYIYMPLTNSQGQAMFEKAETIYNSPPNYNLYAKNCNNVAQEILAGAGLNFAPTSGSATNEKVTLGTIILPGGIPRLIFNYADDRHDKTIPNAAYDYGASIANENGWTVGNTGYKPGWNPFK